VVADWHNIESELMRRYADETPSTFKALVARRTSVLLQRAERKLLACAEAHTVTSERERHAIGMRHPGAVIHTIPNGVDAGRYSPNEVARAARDAGFPPAGRRWLLFVGSMDYHANVNALRWFAHEAWPGIAAHHNDLDLVVVGRDPTPEVRALASKRIKITGTVEDVRPYYGAALAMIVPLRVGGGTRLKILESMAAKAPVISTRLGIEGIDAETDSHYLLADTPEEMSRAVDRLFASPETGQRIAGAAAKLIAARYDWQTIGKALYEVHCEFYERRG
jgi:glycosyltransferase involved in cell wall biosynthesis